MDRGEMPQKGTRVMRKCILPDWLRSTDLRLLGFTEKEDEEEEEESEEESEEEESEEEGEEGKKGKKGEEEERDDEGLKSALKKERLARREATKKFKALEKELGDLKAAQTKKEGEGEQEQTRKETEAAQRKTERLAAKLQTAAVDNAITRVLQDPKLGVKFRDPDDVLRLVNRDDIDVDQDDDDPSEIEIDIDDVKREIKRLAKKKPHLLLTDETSGGETGSGGSTGGKFGGSKSKADKDAERQALMAKYPALTRR